MIARLGWKLSISGFALPHVTSSAWHDASPALPVTAIYLKPPRPRLPSRLQHNMPAHLGWMSKRKTAKPRSKNASSQPTNLSCGACVIKKKLAELSHKAHSSFINSIYLRWSNTTCQSKNNSSACTCYVSNAVNLSVLFTVIDATAAALLARSLLENICLISMGLTWSKVKKSKYVQAILKPHFFTLTNTCLEMKTSNANIVLRAEWPTYFLLYWPWSAR